MAEQAKYAAFISYSSKDSAFARRLHRALEHYGVPGSLGRFQLIPGGKKNRIYPIFRDREELAPGDLGERIRSALTAAESLVVICSPNAAQSPWVQKEIEYFASLGRGSRIFAIIADKAPLVGAAGGDPTASYFPQALHGATGVEAVAADARKGKDGFRNAWLKLVAGLIGVNAGALQNRDRARRTRNTVLASVAGLAFAGTAGWLVLSNQEIARRDADVLDTVDHYEDRAAEVRAALEEQAAEPAPVAAPSEAARAAEIQSPGGITTVEEAPTPGSSQQAEAPTQTAAIPTAGLMMSYSAQQEPQPSETASVDDGRREQVLGAIQSWEEQHGRQLTQIREAFERLHAQHVAALRANELTRAAVIASEINRLLVGRQLSYFSGPVPDTPFLTNVYQEEMARTPAGDLDVGELRRMFASPSQSYAAAALIVAECDAPQCLPALLDVAMGGSIDHTKDAAAAICRLRPPREEIAPIVTRILGAPRDTSPREAESAMILAACMHIATPEIVAGLRAIFEEPNLFRTVQTSNNYVRRNAVLTTLTALGPDAASALPDLQRARERALAREFDWPNLEEVDPAIAAISGQAP